jgi:hypothetical protein
MGFELLPLPESHAPVFKEHGNVLPLEFVHQDWFLLVCTRPSNNEYAIVSGRGLHKNWEHPNLYRFHALGTNFPPTAMKVRCPNGTLLAVKILDYDFSSPELKRDSSAARQPGRASTTGRKPKAKIV